MEDAAAAKSAVKRSRGPGDDIWLNRFWNLRRPSPEVLERIAEELGDDLALFGGDPRTVIAVVKMLSEGRTFAASEHIHVSREEAPAVSQKALESRI